MRRQFGKIGFVLVPTMGISIAWNCNGKAVLETPRSASDRRLLGNGRLISVWPVRGGPVVADGRVYFAAGVWPFEGVFVYSLEIGTGKVVWRNDRMGYLFGQQPHNTHAIGGLAPQGYLLIDKNELIVPCSTAYPARLNRNDGTLIDFQLPRDRAGCQADGFHNWIQIHRVPCAEARLLSMIS